MISASEQDEADRTIEGAASAREENHRGPSSGARDHHAGRATAGASWRISVDSSIGILLVLQVLILFVGTPAGAIGKAGLLISPVCHLLSAVIGAFILARRRLVRLVVIGSIVSLVLLPEIVRMLGWVDDPVVFHEVISIVFVIYNGAITAIIFRYVFGPGPVTAHRILGAILIYLNVASIFASVYMFIAAFAPAAFSGISASGSIDGAFPGPRLDELVHFSITALTTVGYGDIVPVHPLARSLAGLESVFGQLFPATIIARLVGLHLVHQPRRP